ncbi:MAG TPA: NADH-quinone oxidoreductase subunit C [Thermodesulfatator sp.]|nr:NADH-quinone oxidoreductase subunit C [Thermodesulfatator sp.]
MKAVEHLKERFPEDLIAVSHFRGEVTACIRRERLYEILEYLKNDPELLFDHLVDLCGVDWLGKKTPRFEVVYHLYSIRYRQFLRLKVPVPEEDPTLASVVSLWKTANWFERECYEMFGIVFKGHPDLRRLLTPEGWDGYPLRKDYPLFLSPENEWPGYRELVEKVRELSRYDWYPKLASNEDS